MAEKLSQNPLGNMLGHGYQDGNEAECCLAQLVLAGSAAGLNLDSSLFRSTQEKCYASGGVNQFNVCSTSDLLDVKGQSDLLLQPKAVT